jgi:tetratricopeptide (TPR) repeat protein
MEFGYLCTKSQSPHGMPLWWHSGTSYGMFDEKKIVENFIQAKFDILIFLKVFPHEKDARRGMPQEIQNFIAENYWLDDKYQYIDLYRKAKSNSALSYYGRGNTYARLGQYKLAIEYYNKAIRINPNYANAYYIRGIIHLESGQYQKAVQDLSETIRIKPDYISSYYNRGIAYSKTRRYQLAIKDYSEAIRLDSDYADAYNNRGAVYLNLGNNELGCLDARKACELGNCKILKVADSTGVCH